MTDEDYFLEPAWAGGITPLQTEIRRLRAEVEKLRADAIAERRAGDLHRELLRRTAIALGKPDFGKNSSWHDIPDQVAALRLELELHRKSAVEALEQATKYADENRVLKQRSNPLLICIDCHNTESPAGAMARTFNHGRCLHCGGYFKVVQA